MTEEQIREIEGLLARATPGPWTLGDEYPQTSVDRDWCSIDGQDWGAFARVAVRLDREPNAEGEANAALIVAAVNALPALLDERDRLAKRIVFDLEPRALAAESLLAALGERVKELEAGLLPFANLGVTSGPDDEPCSIPYRITRGSIRRARALLQPQGGE